jgi:RNA polymerase sigma-70 factor, ECF subfamily
MPGENERMEIFVQNLTQGQEKLFRYIFSLVSHEPDARDILQETNMALYRKSEQYDPKRPFLAWAYGFAYLQVQKHREKSNRSPLLLSEDVIDLIAHDREHLDTHLDDRLDLLDGCLYKLSPRDQQIISSRYVERQSVETIMERFDLTRRTLFRHLDLIRQQLHECVSLKLRQSQS